MDAQRQLLDQLMGKSRDIPDALKGTVREADVHDKDVCKHFLCGLCPFKALLSTRSDIGACPKALCDNADAVILRDKYSKLSQDEKNLDGFEYDLMRFLDDLVYKCDQKIEKHKKRTEMETQISEDSLKKIAIIESQIQQLTDQCVIAAENGEIDESQDLMRRVDVLKADIENITNPKDQKNYFGVRN